MLDHIGEPDKARRLKEATQAVIAEGASVTYDLKARRDDPSAVGTKEMAEAVVKKIKARFGHG